MLVECYCELFALGLELEGLMSMKLRVWYMWVIKPVRVGKGSLQMVSSELFGACGSCEFLS
jgi:hypothetical protein